MDSHGETSDERLKRLREEGARQAEPANHRLRLYMAHLEQLVASKAHLPRRPQVSKVPVKPAHLRKLPLRATLKRRWSNLPKSAKVGVPTAGAFGAIGGVVLWWRARSSKRK